MTVSFSFENPMTPEILAAVNELHRLTTGRGQTRRAETPPAPTNTTAINPETAPAKPAPPKADAPDHMLTEADVRRAMDECKARVWGAGYDSDPTLTKERKAPLVEAFKAVARLYGADKPSLLATHTARANFIRHISTLELDKDGNVVEGDLPF